MLSLLENAALLDDTFNFQHVASLYPADVIMRARAYRDAGVVIGAYSASQGVPIVRDEVAQYITGAFRHLPIGILPANTWAHCTLVASPLSCDLKNSLSSLPPRRHRA